MNSSIECCINYETNFDVFSIESQIQKENGALLAFILKE